MTTTPPPASWFPDPTGRHQQRYWDGAAWTEHVADNGQTSADPLPPAAPRYASDDVVPVAGESADFVQQQVARASGRAADAAQAAAGWQGSGHIFNEPVLVVNQKAKLIELTNQYAIYDGNGQQLGGVQEVGQSAAKKALRFVSNVDQFLTHRYEVKAMDGTVLLAVTRPRKVMKSTVIVEGPQGHEIGRIVQQNMIGKIRFGLEAGGQAVGSLNAQNWRAWDFSIADATGAEVARVTKTWGGLVKAAFTTADNYVVHIHRPLEDPLRSLVVAAAVTVDTALKQDER